MNFIRDVLAQMQGWRNWTRSIGTAVVVDVALQHFLPQPFSAWVETFVIQIILWFVVDAVIRRHSRVEANNP